MKLHRRRRAAREPLGRRRRVRLGRLLNERRVGRRHDAGPQLTLLLLQLLQLLLEEFFRVVQQRNVGVLV